MTNSANPALVTSVHVRRAADGDRDSVAWLVDRLNPLLLAQASFRMGPTLRRTCDPCDVVHEAWLVLLPRLSQLPERDGRMTPVLLRFLSTTILGKVRNLLRREVRRAGPSLDDPNDAGTALAGDRSEVVSAVVRRERQCAVRDAIAALPDTDRQILLLRGIEQVDAGIVATRLAISRDGVSKRYRRALERLSEQLPESVFPELSPDFGGDGELRAEHRDPSHT